LEILILKIWKISEIINWAIDLLTGKNIENPKLDSEYIISHVLGMSRLELNLHQKDEVAENDLSLIQSMISRRGKNEPLQYILGETNFYGLTLKVNEHVLIPRPETELLVEKIVKENPEVDEILEIGTGSGAIAIVLAANIKNAKIKAVDISNEALQIARENAAKNKVNIHFCFSDVFENVTGKYDLIVSNPPYISNKEYQYLSREIRKYEPSIALLADDNGLAFYKKILCSAKDYLTKKGKIYFEIGYNLSESIKKVAKENGFRNIETVKDLNGFDRMMVIEV
jgi:release factor glutamine methyltransferase